MHFWKISIKDDWTEYLCGGESSLEEYGAILITICKLKNLQNLKLPPVLSNEIY